jgi:uncharacterized protein (TIRG00374 family)
VNGSLERPVDPVATDEQPRRIRTDPIRWVGVGIGFVIIAVLVWRTGPSHVGATLRDLRPWALIASLLLNVPIILFRSLRTRLLLERLGARVPILRLAEAQVIGQTVSGLTPAASGDLIRAYIWNRHDRIAGGIGALVVIAERIYSLILLVLAGLIAAAWELGGWPLRAIALASIVLIALPYVGARLGLLDAGVRLIGRLPILRRRARLGTAMAEAVDALARHPLLQLQFCILTAIVFLLSGLQIWVLVMSVGAIAPLSADIAGYCLSQVGGSISTLPFGLGAGDTVLVVLLLRAGVAAQAATAVAVLLRLSTTLPMALCAILTWMHLGATRRRQRIEP